VRLLQDLRVRLIPLTHETADQLALTQQAGQVFLGTSSRTVDDSVSDFRYRGIQTVNIPVLCDKRLRHVNCR